MYAGVVEISVEPGRIDEVIDGFSRNVVPNWKQQKGAERLLLLVDRQSGKALSIGLWDSEESARAFETSGQFRQRSEEMSAVVGSGPLNRVVYEVALDS